MSGDRRRSDPERSEAAAGFLQRDFDARVRQFAELFGFDSEKVQYVCQIPDASETVYLWEFWQGQTRLQVRTERSGRFLSEEAEVEQPPPSDLKQSD